MREGHIRTIKQLISMGALFDHADTKHQRPIFYAIQANKYETVKYLLELGASLTQEDKKGVTPTDHAKKLNKIEIL